MVESLRRWCVEEKGQSPEEFDGDVEWSDFKRRLSRFWGRRWARAVGKQCAFEVAYLKSKITAHPSQKGRWLAWCKAWAKKCPPDRHFGNGCCSQVKSLAVPKVVNAVISRAPILNLALGLFKHERAGFGEKNMCVCMCACVCEIDSAASHTS